MMKLFDLMKVVVVDSRNIISIFNFDCTDIDCDLTVLDFRKKYGNDVDFLNREVYSIGVVDGELFITLK